jgi:hypothetical protein
LGGTSPGAGRRARVSGDALHFPWTWIEKVDWREFLGRAKTRARRRRVPSAALALLSIALGSWFVSVYFAFSSPAASQPGSLAALRNQAGNSSDPQLAPYAPGATFGQLGSTTDPAVTSTTLPVSTTLAPSTTLPPPVTTTTPAPSTSVPSTTTATTTAPTTAPSTTPVTTTKGRNAFRSSAPLVQGTTGTAAGIASSIITEVNHLSGGTYKIPVTSDNVGLLESWMANEGGLWANNPLNSDLNGSKYPHQFNGSQDTGTPIYPSMAVGIESAAQTLLANPAYSRILASLSSGDVACSTFAEAVIESPWAASHYGYDASRFCSGAVPTLVVPGQGRGQGGHGHGHGRGAAPRKPTPTRAQDG